MRILTLSNFYPPANLGGYEQVCAEVNEGLIRRGHQVCVLTSRHGGSGSHDPAAPVHRLLHPEIDLRQFRAALQFFVGRRNRIEQNLACLRQSVAAFEPDVILVWGMWNLTPELLLLAESWKRPPVAYYIADYWPTLPDAYQLYWHEPGRRRLTNVAKRIVRRLSASAAGTSEMGTGLKLANAAFVSRAVRERLTAAGYPFRNAPVIYNGIDVRKFAPANASRAAGPPSLAILYAGRVSHDKGVHTAIEALGELRRRGHHASLTIVGWTAAGYDAELRGLARRAAVADRVQLRPPVAREQMPALLAGFDVLVLPSLWAEPLPRMIQESMACGIVVAAAAVGGMGEIIEHDRNGLLFTPGDAAGLANVLAELARDPQRGISLARAALETVRSHFTIDRMVDQLGAHLAQVVRDA